MKSIKFCICLILLISCENFEASHKEISNPTHSYLNEIEDLKSLYVQSIDIGLEALENKNSKTKQNEPYLNQEEFVMGILKVMDKDQMVLENGVKRKFIHELEKFIPNNNIQARINNNMLFESKIFSLHQEEILIPFINDLELSNNPQHSKNVAISFQNEIINDSNLNYEEKISLLSITSGTIVFSEFILNDGIEKMRDKLIPDNNDQIETLGCSVNMRNVWLGAVLSAGAGAIGGAKIGCTGGVVAGPFGVAGGCVGGAVMGGATGFISGAFMTAGAELLGSCFR
ncbi:hypothetical protein [Cyclobacterium plantarum]|uniref:Glycine zipper family protein n=1 Tax=Cyclobacterium plantarum TaxID=2716263 RepID=A0ABX0H1S5_9BACT|nr:hypothetical protein [Cyclobacterium plantarum]NHE55392.1 hypothetical protein [Cyclobacterium plantarum]